MRRAVLGATVLAICSCGGVPPDQGTSASSTGLSVGTVDIDTAGPTESGEPTGGSNSGSIKFDVGALPDASEPPGSEGCKHVDVVIAIDNSGSMQEEIEALAGPVFDSFPQALLDVGNGLDDFQLGVIDACNDPPFLHDTGAGGACNYTSGTNYMVSSSPALFDEYHCVTELTQSGYMGMDDDCSGENDDEQPASTAAGVVSPPAVDGANAGFLRDDAVLFIVAITDEDEQPVPDQSAQEIADRIIAAKGTINNVVFLGIGGGSDCDGPYGTADDAVLLREISLIFADQSRGLFWDLCQGNLEQAFQAALAVVDSACIEFEPPA